MAKAITEAEKRERRRRHQAAAEANIRTRRIGKRGEVDRRILVDVTVDGVEKRFHATKGRRVQRVASAAGAA